MPPFDPFNPSNNYQGSSNPVSSNIGAMPNMTGGGWNPFNQVNPTFAAVMSSRQMTMPDPMYSTPSQYGVFRGPVSYSGPSPAAYLTRPMSTAQSIAVLTSLTDYHMGSMPIEQETRARRGLQQNFIGGAAFGTDLAMGGIAGSMAYKALAARGFAGGMLGGATLGGLAIGTGVGMIGSAWLGAVQKRQNMLNYIQDQTRGLVTGGRDLDVSGRGLSMDASNNLLSSMTQISKENFRFNRTDLQKVLEIGRKENLFQFTGQSGKDIGKAIKNISDMIHQFSQIVETGDLESAAQVLGQFQTYGISQKHAIGAARNMRRFAKMAGVDVGELISGQGSMGAQAYQSVGLTAGSGMQMGGMMAGFANSLSKSGAMSPTQMALAGGQQGLTQLATQFSAQFLQSEIGTNLLRGMITQKNGSFILDKKKMDDIRSGKTSLEEAFKDVSQLKDASGNVSANLMAKFEGQKGELIEGIAAQGPEALLEMMRMQVTSYKKMFGGKIDNSSALQLIGKNMGFSATQMKYMETMMYDTGVERDLNYQKIREGIENSHQERMLRREENSFSSKMVLSLRSAKDAAERGLGIPQATGYLNRMFDEKSKSALRYYESPEEQAALAAERYGVEGKNRGFIRGSGAATGRSGEGDFGIASFDRGWLGTIQAYSQSPLAAAKEAYRRGKDTSSNAERFNNAAGFIMGAALTPMGEVINEFTSLFANSNRMPETTRALKAAGYDVSTTSTLDENGRIVQTFNNNFGIKRAAAARLEMANIVDTDYAPLTQDERNQATRLYSDTLGKDKFKKLQSIYEDTNLSPQVRKAIAIASGDTDSLRLGGKEIRDVKNLARSTGTFENLEKAEKKFGKQALTDIGEYMAENLPEDLKGKSFDEQQKWAQRGILASTYNSANKEERAALLKKGIEKGIITSEEDLLSSRINISDRERRAQDKAASGLKLINTIDSKSGFGSRTEINFDNLIQGTSAAADRMVEANESQISSYFGGKGTEKLGLIELTEKLQDMSGKTEDERRKILMGMGSGGARLEALLTTSEKIKGKSKEEAQGIVSADTLENKAKDDAKLQNDLMGSVEEINRKQLARLDDLVYIAKTQLNSDQQKALEDKQKMQNDMMSTLGDNSANMSIPTYVGKDKVGTL